MKQVNKNHLVHTDIDLKKTCFLSQELLCKHSSCVDEVGNVDFNRLREQYYIICNYSITVKYLYRIICFLVFLFFLFFFFLSL